MKTKQNSSSERGKKKKHKQKFYTCDCFKINALSYCISLFLTLSSCLSFFPAVEESDIIDLEKRYWLLKAQSRTGRFDLETFVPLVSPPIHASLSEGQTIFVQLCFLKGFLLLLLIPTVISEYNPLQRLVLCIKCICVIDLFFSRLVSCL